MTDKQSSNEGEHLNIFFTDLTLKAQLEVLKHYNVSCPTQLNADVFPLCTIPQGESEAETMIVQIELEVPSNTHTLHLEFLDQDEASTMMEYNHHIVENEILQGEQIS